MPSLIQHHKSTKHCPCPHCDPFEIHEVLLEARLSPVDRYSCPECKRRFPLKPSLEAHQCESLHAYCFKCDIPSSTRQLHALHMQLHTPVRAMTPSSATQFRCCDCESDFNNEWALIDHLRSSINGVGKRCNEKKEKKGMKCKKCERLFKTRNALEQHLTSVRHNPLSDIKCVADAECKKRFNCPSAQLQHLETGRCVSGMTRAQLNAAIAANDTGRIITSGGVAGQLLLDDDHPSTTSTSQIRSPILTPTSTEFLDSYQSSAILTPTSTLSTSSNFDSMLTPRPRIRSPLLTPTSTEFLDSYPPSAILTPTSTLTASPNFESMFTFRPPIRSDYQRCPLCPPSRTRTFKHGALQQHLSSSVHAQVSMSLPFPIPDEISFHCPQILMGEGSKKKVVRQFSTVSGLAKHLESGACDGGKGTFRRVMDYVQEEMKDMGFDELKLLI